MNAPAAIHEVLHNITFAHALVLQLILETIIGSADASAFASGSKIRGMLCTSAGATPTLCDPADVDQHQLGGNCDSTGCAAPAPSAQILSAVLSPERLVDAASCHWAETSIRDPAVRLASQAPRAPPLMS